MSSAPRVSVVMAVRDGESFLADAIESVLGQDQRELELVLVDDGSRDTSPAIAQHYAERDGRVRVERLSQGRGVSVALQQGLLLARGEFIARLDADDLAAPGRLSIQLRALDADPGLVLIGGAYDLIDAAGQPIGTVRGPTDARELRWLLLFGNVFCASTVAFRRAVALEAGGYRPEFSIGEDYDLWVRLARRGHVAQLDRVLATRRIHGRNISLIAPAELREHYVRTVAESIEGFTGVPVSAEAARWLAAETSVLPQRPGAVPEAIASISRCLEQAGTEGWGAVALPLAVRELVRVARRARPGARGAPLLPLAIGWALRHAPAHLARATFWRELAGVVIALLRPGEPPPVGAHVGGR